MSLRCLKMYLCTKANMHVLHQVQESVRWKPLEQRGNWVNKGMSQKRYLNFMDFTTLTHLSEV
jgi:hypothetical protein